LVVSEKKKELRTGGTGKKGEERKGEVGVAQPSNREVDFLFNRISAGRAKRKRKRGKGNRKKRSGTGARKELKKAAARKLRWDEESSIARDFEKIGHLWG